MVRRIRSSTDVAPKTVFFTAEEIVALLKQIPELDGLPIFVSISPQGAVQFTVGNYHYDTIITDSDTVV